MSWRKEVDPLLKEHLEMQIRESHRHKEIYSKSGNKGDAQLWVAVANLSRQIFDLQLRIKSLEKVLSKKVLRGIGEMDKNLLKNLKKF